MKIIEKDIQNYTAFMEFAYDDLVRCHPSDEKKMRAIYEGNKKVLEALEELKKLLDEVK